MQNSSCFHLCFSF